MNTAIPQLDPKYVAGRAVPPERYLVAAILERMILDLKDEGHRKKATAFLRSKDFEVYCDWLGLDAGSVRQRLHRMTDSETTAHTV